MVLLQIRSGTLAGQEVVARRFPFRIGRAAGNPLRLEAPGVWEQHARLELDRVEGFVVVAEGEALTLANGAPVRRTRLRSGDVLELGEVKIQFWLSPARQGGLQAREWFTWTGLALLAAGQAGAIYWLLE